MQRWHAKPWLSKLQVEWKIQYHSIVANPTWLIKNFSFKVHYGPRCFTHGERKKTSFVTSVICKNKEDFWTFSGDRVSWNLELPFERNVGVVFV